VKIAILNFRNIGHPKKGGAEVYLEKLCEEWIIEGHKISFFSPKHPETDKSRFNAEVEYVQVGNRFTTYFKIRRAIKKIDFDLIIDSVNVRGFNTPNIKWKRSKAPRVLSIIYQTAEDIWDNETSFPLSWIGKKILEPYWLRKYRNTKVLTISNSSMHALKIFGLDHIKVIHPGRSALSQIDNYGKRAYKKEIVLVFCARIVAMKRPIDAIEILQYLEQMQINHKFKLKVIGSGPLLENMKKKAAQARLPVEFLGFVENHVRDEIFRGADFLLATSVREGWGMTVTEAAIQGCVTIGYDVAGLRDSVLLANGQLCSPTPLDAAKTISNLLLNQKVIRPNKTGGLDVWSEVAKSILIESYSD